MLLWLVGCTFYLRWKGTLRQSPGASVSQCVACSVLEADGDDPMTGVEGGRCCATFTGCSGCLRAVSRGPPVAPSSMVIGSHALCSLPSPKSRPWQQVLPEHCLYSLCEHSLYRTFFLPPFTFSIPAGSSVFTAMNMGIPHPPPNP